MSPFVREEAIRALLHCWFGQVSEAPNLGIDGAYFECLKPYSAKIGGSAPDRVMRLE